MAVSRRDDNGRHSGGISYELLGLKAPTEQVSLEAITGIATEPLK